MNSPYNQKVSQFENQKKYLTPIIGPNFVVIQVENKYNTCI
jgi:hypothetical protein